MSKRRTDKSHIYKYAALLLSVVFLISAGFFFLNLCENSNTVFTEPNPDSPYYHYNGRDYELNEDIETFLVLGLDKNEDAAETADAYNNDKQADFLMLFVFDNDAQTCSALQISRDTMAEVNVLGVAGNKINTVTSQIALAHTYGNGKEVSCRNTSDAVSSLLFDMRIHHYISVTMDAVPIFNDQLGGVNVMVTDDFTGVDDTLTQGTEITLTGEQALMYVRARYGLADSSNLNRMKRQKQYIRALYETAQTKFANDDALMVETTLKLADYIVSDRSVTQLQELFRKISSYEFTGIIDIEGETKKGDRFLEFYPNRDSLEQIVVSLFYK